MNAIGFLKKGYIVRVIALNTGRQCSETQGARAVTLVQSICDECAELATSSGAAGYTSTEADSKRNVLGTVSSVLTPRKKEV